MSLPARATRPVAADTAGAELSDPIALSLHDPPKGPSLTAPRERAVVSMRSGIGLCERGTLAEARAFLGWTANSKPRLSSCSGATGRSTACSTI